MYTRIFRINFNNKQFDIFSDGEHKKVFLEVKDNKYYYPLLEDNVRLSLIYNGNDYNKLYNDKFNIDGTKIKKIAINTVNFLVALTSITSTYLLVRVTNLGGARYTEDLYINCNAILEDYGYQDVNFNDVRNTLKTKDNFPEKYYNYIEEYISLLERKLPEVDLRVFNKNLETLKLFIEPVEYVDDIRTAYYDLDKNSIFMPELNENTKEIFFHELTHLLNSSQRHIVDENSNITRAFFTKGYGIGINEGSTEVITNYLLDEETDNFDDYLNKDNVYFNAYEDFIAPSCFDLFKLIKDDYTVYDYLNGNIEDYKKVLENYGLEDVVDALDTVYDSMVNKVNIWNDTELLRWMYKIDSKLEEKEKQHIR